jgi:hypothetical protein
MGEQMGDLLEGESGNEWEDELEVPAAPGRWRRGLVIILALPLALAVGATLWGMLHGTWSIAANVHVPEGVLDEIADVREEVAALGTVPGAVSWLDAALVPEADGADVLGHIRAALDELEAADDPRLTGPKAQLRAIIAEFSPVPYSPMITPPLPTWSTD